jgi:hypothetical protein
MSIGENTMSMVRPALKAICFDHIGKPHALALSIVRSSLFALPPILFALGISPVAAGTIIIKTAIELQQINKNLAGDYELGADIDASATKSWNSGAGFIPIGANASKPASPKAFSGTLNGVGHTISNLRINSSGTNVYTGLFAYIDTKGTVKNLKLTNVSIGSSYQGFLNGKYQTGYIAALAALNYGSVTAVTATGTVVLEGYQNVVAGLIGLNLGSVANSGADVEVEGAQIDSETNVFVVAGLVGWNYRDKSVVGKIVSSYSDGKIVGDLSENGIGGTSFTGGIAGLNVGTIEKSSSSNSVYCADCSVGGLVGGNEPKGTIESSHSSATITGGGEQLGGLVGYNYAGGLIEKSWATGAVTTNGNETYVGGLTGWNDGTITQSWAKGDVLGKAGTSEEPDISQLGGLVGYNNDTGIIEKSYATGNATDNINGPPGGISIGGLVGVNVGGPKGGIVTQCYAAGAVSATGEETSVGGLVGTNQYSHANGLVEYSYATGSTKGGPSSGVGAVVGNNNEATISQVIGIGKVTGGKGALLGGVVGTNYASNDPVVRSSFWDRSTTGRSVGAGIGSQAGMSGDSNAQLKSGKLPTGFAATIWAAKAGFYPYLRWQPAP